MTTTETREELRLAEYNSYDPDNFPGSRGWRANQAARKALADYDAAHPELVAEIAARKDAKAAAEKAYWASPEGVEKQMAIARVPAQNGKPPIYWQGAYSSRDTLA